MKHERFRKILTGKRLWFTIAPSNDNKRLSLAIRDDLRFIAQHVDILQVRQGEQSRQNRVTADIIKSDSRKVLLFGLSPIDFRATHIDISSRRATNTGKWLLKSTEYQDGLQGPTHFSWCSGIPGSGKTILASLVLNTFISARQETLSQNSHVGIASIYCTYRFAGLTVVMLGSTLKQLVERLTDLPKSVVGACERPSLDGIMKAYAQIVPFYSSIFNIVDALDECNGRFELLK